jgi:hypothetical protein
MIAESNDGAARIPHISGVVFRWKIHSLVVTKEQSHINVGTFVAQAVPKDGSHYTTSQEVFSPARGAL